MVIVAVLVFVGLFYCLGLSGDEESEAQMYRAEVVRREESAEVTSGTLHAETAAEKTAGAETLREDVTAAVNTENGGTEAMSASAVHETDRSVTEAVGTEAGTPADDRINLNTASLEALDSLPGIGPATAKLILEYRQQYGGFAAPEEIMNVKRIGEKTYEKLKDRIRV